MKTAEESFRYHSVLFWLSARCCRRSFVAAPEEPINGAANLARFLPTTRLLRCRNLTDEITELLLPLRIGIDKPLLGVFFGCGIGDFDSAFRNQPVGNARESESESAGRRLPHFKPRIGPSRNTDGEYIAGRFHRGDGESVEDSNPLFSLVGSRQRKIRCRRSLKIPNTGLKAPLTFPKTRTTPSCVLKQ